MFLLIFVLAHFCRGQDAAPVNLDFGPEKNAARQSDRAQTEGASRRAVYDLRVRSVKVVGRWNAQVRLPLAAGDTLTREKLSEALNALRLAITSNANTSLGLRSKGEVGVLYIAVDYDTSTADGTVGVIFRPYYVDISLVEVGKNVLPIPRSPWATIYKNVPEALRAFNPMASLSYDRAFGTAVSASIDADLVSLVGMSDSFGLTHQISLRAEGTKSLEEVFYRSNGGVSYSINNQNSVFEAFTFSADFDAIKMPLGTGQHTREAASAVLVLKSKLAPNTHLYANAGYRRSSDSFVDGETLTKTNYEANEQSARLLLDSIPPSITGFFRAALWQESAWQSDASYQRVVLRLGYEKEIAIAPNQTIGIEVVAGGGSTFGDVPAYAKFFGGNAPGQFLYDNATGSTLMNMPSGPVIRSLGENEAHLRNGPSTFGGETFWNVNLNVTIPIPRWSMPLIPNEETDIPDINGNPVSLKQLLRRQIDVTGPSMLSAVLQQQGLSADQAARRAKEILGEVTPATHFIIDEANLYAIKPLLMFDAAGLSGPGGADETWFAAGGGIQLTVVTAKFEAGYLRTISGPTFGSQGNFFVRLVFQNLF